MSDTHTYHIQLSGQINADEINATSPLEITVTQVDTAKTNLTIYTDQSGLIGLIRHLHARGLALLCINRKSQTTRIGDRNVN